ncbi:RNase H domain-containing protein [Ditylenchus destructor]|uniref:ribonuclease H n=1 Tax=Ditylenchus destructor TaxID=166010 RepID=A0AAD4MYK6_9BILA|nr:RNase H domain-containing protein [Ditylenchus destructor]
MMHRNWFSVRNIVGNVARCFASDAAVESKVGSSKLVELKKPAGWAMPEKTAFIDGICMGRNHKASAGFGVFWGENHADNTYGAVEGAQTSPRAKFAAAIEAVKQAHKNGDKEVALRTESLFLYNCMTHWVSGWKTNGLKDLIQELDDLSAKLEVRYELIDEEKGDFGHDNANRLAIAGAKLALQERGVDPATASKPTARASKPKETGPRAKFVAAIETVKQALDNGQREVTVRTDSDFLYNCMTRWVSGWKKYGWKNIEGEEVKNKDLIQELDDLSAKLEVSYELVQKPKKSKAITLD